MLNLAFPPIKGVDFVDKADAGGDFCVKQRFFYLLDCFPVWDGDENHDLFHLGLLVYSRGELCSPVCGLRSGRCRWSAERLLRSEG